MSPLAAILSRLAGALAGAALGHVAHQALGLWLPLEGRPLVDSEAAAYGIPLLGALYGVLAGPMLLDRPAGARRRIAAAASTGLAGLGAAFLGSAVGVAAFGLANALLARAGRDDLLDDRLVYLAFAVAGGLAAFLAALVLARRWRAPAGRGAGVKLVALAALAGVGGGWAGNYVGYALGIMVNRVLGIESAVSKEIVILCTVAGTLALFLAAILLALRALRPELALKPRLGHAALALPLALVLASSAMAVSRGVDARSAGDPPTIFFEIRLPSGARAPARADVKVTLLTEQGTETAELYQREWLLHAEDRLVLKGFFDTRIRHPKQRVVALALPGAPARLFDLRLPRKPKSTRGYGAWQRVDFVGEIGRAAAPDDDSAIRFYAWRP